MMQNERLKLDLQGDQGRSSSFFSQFLALCSNKLHYYWNFPVKSILVGPYILCQVKKILKMLRLYLNSEETKSVVCESEMAGFTLLMNLEGNSL